jgi:hypothetical protein
MSARKKNTAESNPSVARCCRAYRTAWRAVVNAPGVSDSDIDYDEAEDKGERAFANAIPPLVGLRNVRNYIACVAHGAARGFIDPKDVSSLLYAAQIAVSTCRAGSKKEKSLVPRRKTSKSPLPA